MKKTISLFVAVLLLATVVLSACNQTAKPSEPGGLEDSIFDNPSSGPAAQQPSSGTNASQPASSGSTTPPSSGESTSVPSAPVTPTTGPSEMPDNDIWEMDYETFQNLSGEEQRAFQEKFPSIEDFFGWYNAAKFDYEQENPPIEVGGDGQVDMDDLGAN